MSAYQHIVPVFGSFAQNLALYNNTIESFCLRPYVCQVPSEILYSNVNIKSPRATFHTIVPSTEELFCLIRWCSIHPIHKGDSDIFIRFVSKLLCDKDFYFLLAKHREISAYPASSLDTDTEVVMFKCASGSIHHASLTSYYAGDSAEQPAAA